MGVRLDANPLSFSVSELQSEHMFAYALVMFSSAIRRLRSISPSGLPRGELVDLVSEFRRLESAAAAAEARVVSAINSLPDNGLDGAGVLRVVGHKSSRVASRISTTAEMLSRLPLTAAALESGKITWSHASSIAAAAEKTSPGQADLGLVQRAGECPADLFSKHCRGWVARNLPDPPDDPDEPLARHRSDRGVSDWTGRDGMSNIHIKLAPADGSVFLAELDRRANEMFNDDGGRDGAPGEVRTFAQRRADAIMSMVDSGSPTTGDGRRGRAPHPKHQVTVVADISRLRSSEPSGFSGIVGNGAPLPQSLLEMLACNSTLTGVLLDGPGRPIFVGRSHRSATNAQWVALIARDGGCVGCGAGVNRCEAHHVQPWQSHGATDISNLVLLCSRCHHDVHDRGVQLIQRDGRWQIRLKPPPTGRAHPPDRRRSRSTSRSSPATREPFTSTAVPGANELVADCSAAMASSMSAAS